MPTPPSPDDQMTTGTAPCPRRGRRSPRLHRRATLRILALRLEDADRTGSGTSGARSTTVVDEIHTRLRSPIHPRSVGREQLVHTTRRRRRHNVPRHVAVVLAAPTAERELPGFLGLARALQGHLWVRLEPLLVRWSDLNHPISDHEFQRVAASLHTMLAQGKPGHARAGRHPRGGDHRLTIDAPIDVAAAQQEVTRAIAHGTTDQRLLDDLAWIHTFHTRHDSLSDSDSHPDQPLLDLAIRRAIGRRLSACWVDDTHTVAATSEPHRRFLPCYATSTTILNLRLT